MGNNLEDMYKNLDEEINKIGKRSKLKKEDRTKYFRETLKALRGKEGEVKAMETYRKLIETDKQRDLEGREEVTQAYLLLATEEKRRAQKSFRKIDKEIHFGLALSFLKLAKENIEKGIEAGMDEYSDTVKGMRHIEKLALELGTEAAKEDYKKRAESFKELALKTREMLENYEKKKKNK